MFITILSLISLLVPEVFILSLFLTLREKSQSNKRTDISVLLFIWAITIIGRLGLFGVMNTLF